MNGYYSSNSGFGQEIESWVLARAQRGDMQAFAELYRRFGNACFQLALRILGQRAQAEDLVQEVFLKMMQSIRSYRGDAPFGAWLKRMSVNACIDHLRRQRHLNEVDAETTLSHAVDSPGEPIDRIDAWSLLARLSPRARAIVVLHELEGYTHTELGAMFKHSESYSKSILSRALKRLNAVRHSGQDHHE